MLLVHMASGLSAHTMVLSEMTLGYGNKAFMKPTFCSYTRPYHIHCNEISQNIIESPHILRL